MASGARARSRRFLACLTSCPCRQTGRNSALPHKPIQRWVKPAGELHSSQIHFAPPVERAGVTFPVRNFPSAGSEEARRNSWHHLRVQQFGQSGPPAAAPAELFLPAGFHFHVEPRAHLPLADAGSSDDPPASRSRAAPISSRLRAAVLGANDGIVSTASLVVGVAAAQSTASDILVAGVAGLVAGAMSMTGPPDS